MALVATVVACVALVVARVLRCGEAPAGTTSAGASVVSCTRAALCASLTPQERVGVLRVPMGERGAPRWACNVSWSEAYLWGRDALGGGVWSS